MPDLALRWNPDEGSADLALSDIGDDLASGGDLETATLLSIGLDRRADAGDTLPADDGDRRGWWGDEFLEPPGSRIGSRRWQLARAAARADVPRQLEQFDREALAWFVEDRVASAVEVTAEARGGDLGESITIRRPKGEAVTLRFAWAWEDFFA